MTLYLSSSYYVAQPNLLWLCDKVVDTFLIFTSSTCLLSFKLPVYQNLSTESNSMMTHLNFDDFNHVIVRTVPKFSLSCSILPSVFILKYVHLVHGKMPCCQNPSPFSLRFIERIDAGTVRKLDVTSTSAPNLSTKQNVVKTKQLGVKKKRNLMI